MKIFIDSLPEEPASDDLEEEINNYFSDWIIGLDEHKDFIQIAHHFAEWGRNYVIETIEETLGYIQTHDISAPQIMLLRIWKVLDKLKTNKFKFQ